MGSNYPTTDGTDVRNLSLGHLNTSEHPLGTACFAAFLSIGCSYNVLQVIKAFERHENSL